MTRDGTDVVIAPRHNPADIDLEMAGIASGQEVRLVQAGDERPRIGPHNLESVKIDSAIGQRDVQGGVIRVRTNFGASFRERITAASEPPLVLSKRDAVPTQVAPTAGSDGRREDKAQPNDDDHEEPDDSGHDSSSDVRAH